MLQYIDMRGNASYKVAAHCLCFSYNTLTKCVMMSQFFSYEIFFVSVRGKKVIIFIIFYAHYSD